MQRRVTRFDKGITTVILFFVKTAVSIPDPIFRAADRTARRLKISRSEFYAKAVAAFVEAHGGADVTRRLNEVYGGEQSEIDPVIQSMALASLEPDSW
jgi:hypothetical protein